MFSLDLQSKISLLLEGDSEVLVVAGGGGGGYFYGAGGGAGGVVHAPGFQLKKM